MKTNRKNQTQVIEAAGGVLWKETSSGYKLAIIHRQRYDDWSLPKGKREPGERWEDTALREVREETGCEATLGKFIGSSSYIINHYSMPKVVLFWHMHIKNTCIFQPNKEVDRVKWVSPKKAQKLLSYQDERDIIRTAVKQLRKLNKIKENQK
jgi:8-oxo-dGTP diphosphatase